MRREIVFTAYNRVDYIKQTITSWNNVRKINEYSTTFFVEPSHLEAHIVAEISKLDTNLKLHINSEKRGVLVNPWHALDTAFSNGADFVVLAEDDVVVSSDTLELFEWASECYAQDESVLAVNMFSQVGGTKANQVIRDGKFSPLVWGTWVDRWDSILRDTWDKDYSTGNSDGSEAGWDWNINRILSSSKKDVIKPIQSRSDHMGKLAGTHMTPEFYDSSRGLDFIADRGRQVYLEV